MDITLIKSGNYYWDKIAQRDIVSDTEMTQLADCGMVLLHKVGLRPLYIEGTKMDIELSQKPENPMEIPDLILHSPNDVDTQSAKIIQFQLAHGNCPVEIKTTDFIKNASNIDNKDIYKNMFLAHLDSLEKKGYKHVVIVADEKNIDKMAFSLNGQGLNRQYVFPIYSFVNGQEIVDKNLISSIYITRDMIDSLLLWQFEHSKEPCFRNGKGKYRPALQSTILRCKLNLPEFY